jgi:hypothetical protein
VGELERRSAAASASSGTLCSMAASAISCIA